MTRSEDRWELAASLFDAARVLPPERRAGFLEEACPDADLRAEVEVLLRAHMALERPDAPRFLEHLDAGRAAALLATGDPATIDADALAPGDALGRYRIIRRLGHGGMGVVYLAQDERLGRTAAIKLLRRHLSLDESARRRFEEEARAASSLDHPNIITIYDIGDAPDGRLFIAMAFHEGETLREELQRGPLPVARAVSLVRQLASGLAAAHARGIVHRDIKPENVLVTTGGVAKLVDFGIAKFAGGVQAGSGETPGTAAYMSPEQTMGAPVDGRSDLWSVGVLLYELLTGERPFPGATRAAVVAAIQHDEPRPVELRRPDVPAALAAVVQRCLVKDPAARLQRADEFLAALEPTADPVPELRRLPRRALAVTAVAVILTVLAGMPLLRATTGSRIPESATAIAVMPPLPATEDSALARLGRELTLTLSASLDGMGELRTVSAGTVLAQAGPHAITLEERARIAGLLGATSVIHGSLLRTSALVRLDIGLFTVSSLAPLARVSVTAFPDDITALTDSAALGLLRELWRRGRAPVPSLAAMTTRSLPALRAYLDGELSIARGEYDQAVPAFERAVAEDSTFWLAYWRSLYPRVYEGSRPDSAALARLVASREHLPDPYRLMVEAFAADSLGVRLALLQRVTMKFPTYWPGWYDFADALLHLGPYLGRTYADARYALERVATLNPEFASSWQHLLWTAVRMRDASAAERSLRRVEAAASSASTVASPVNLAYYRMLRGLLDTDGTLSATAAGALADAVLAPGVRVPPETIAIDVLSMGYPRAQLALSDAILARAPPPDLAEAQRMGRAFAWAARGAWDSALVAAGEWVRQSNHPQVPLRAFGLAVTGAWAGAIAPALAEQWRPARAPAGAEPELLAELHWLDGILAFVKADLPGIARARHELAATGSASVSLLGSSLDAFYRYASGDHDGGTSALAAAEWDFAERDLPAPRRAGSGKPGVSRYHPYLSAINRLTAARWVLAGGDTLQAMRLLTWHEAVISGDPIHVRLNAANRVVEPLALLERARLAAALGRLPEAREHYRAFLERYDLPRGYHEAWLGEARAALRRLPPDNGPPPAGPRRTGSSQRNSPVTGRRGPQAG